MKEKTEMKPPGAFLGTLDFAEEFFTRCGLLKPDNLENRKKLLEEMVGEMKAIRMNEQDVKQYVKGKGVAFFKRKGNK